MQRKGKGSAVCGVPARCSRFGPARVSDFEMPEQRPVPASSECRRVRESGRGGSIVEGGGWRCGLYQVAAGVLLGSQPSASLAATARPQCSRRGADADRSAVFEAPPFARGLDFVWCRDTARHGGVLQCTVCAGRCLVSSILYSGRISRSVGRVGPEHGVCGVLQSAASGVECGCRCRQGRELQRQTRKSGRFRLWVVLFGTPKQESGACWRDGIDGTARQGSRGVLRMKGVGAGLLAGNMPGRAWCFSPPIWVGGDVGRATRSLIGHAVSFRGAITGRAKPVRLFVCSGRWGFLGFNFVLFCSTSKTSDPQPLNPRIMKYRESGNAGRSTTADRMLHCVWLSKGNRFDQLREPTAPKTGHRILPRECFSRLCALATTETASLPLAAGPRDPCPASPRFT